MLVIVVLPPQNLKGGFSMSTLKFHEDGPIIISDADYESYCDFFHQENVPSFDNLYYLWLNENHPDGIRRLALRDMLRQSGTISSIVPNRVISYNTTHDVSRLFNIGGHNSTKELYWTLHNRPKLRLEMMSELVYSLNHGYVVTVFINRHCDAASQLIELILTFVNTPNTDTARVL